ncbi:unnamed protein product [Paramecium octaurelia]|uniref:Transmembrane protein n=1 Tax=Paramecium octaurelia TaxID=43137 RepID=A0A8S1UDV9_PAROT|nr:unnamed protein product [Paramecium octaurelia]
MIYVIRATQCNLEFLLICLQVANFRHSYFIQWNQKLNQDLTQTPMELILMLEKSNYEYFLVIKSYILLLSTLKFNKELAETFNEDYIDLMQKIVLLKLEQIALFQVESKDFRRGKLQFLGNQKPYQVMQSTEVVKVKRSCKQQNALGLVFIVLHIYKLLFNLGIQFLKFNILIIIKLIQICLQYSSFVYDDTIKGILSQNAQSSTKEICRYLDSHLEEQHQAQYSSYAELIQTIVKKHIIKKHKQAELANIFLEHESKQLEGKQINENFDVQFIEQINLSYFNILTFPK